MYQVIKSWAWEPLPDPEQDKDVPVQSRVIKEWAMVLLVLVVAFSVVVLLVCLNTGRTDLRWHTTLLVLGILWVVMGGLALGLFVSHPVYKERLRQVFVCKEKPPVNVLLEPEDLEISL